MATVFDPKSQMHVCIRRHGIIGYGDTPKSAEAMADEAEAEQRRCSEKKAQPVMRWRLNVKTMRYEAVAE